MNIRLSMFLESVAILLLKIMFIALVIKLL